MTPYYQDDSVTIYHGDCREILPELDVQADLVLTDPPYGIGYEPLRARHNGSGWVIPGDESISTAESLLGASLRLLAGAKAVFVFCDWRSLSSARAAMRSAGYEPRTCLVWDKGWGVQNLDRFAKSHELLLYAGPYGGEPTVSRDVWMVPRDIESAHPTPKPVGLLNRAILAASVRGDLVVDPFMGAGSTLRAAKDCERRAIGIEIEERWCEQAASRLAQETLGLSA